MKALLLLLLLGSDTNVPAELVDEARPAAWIAADVAIAADGTVREDKLKVYAPFVKQYAVGETKEARKGARTPCATYIVRSPETGPAHTPEKLVSSAVTIVHGRIVGIREGFYYGMPGSLLRLTGTFLRGNSTNEVYLFYPMATIATADGMVCAKPWKRYGAPKVGDEVIVFDPLPSPAVFGQRTILWVNVHHQLVYVPGTGAPILPEPLRGFAAEDDPVAAVLAIVH